MGMTNQRGNIFTVLFGAVVVVGIITAATMQMISGPIKTASRVNTLNMANANMQTAGRILIIDAANQANSGDVDSDGTIEPREFTTQTGGITGGGSIPTVVGANRTDPWGTLYGYCVWNNGSSYGALTNILAGAVTTGTPVPTVIALVSAGPDKTFQTSCAAYGGGTTSGDTTTTGVIKVSGSDDIVMKWSYAEALAASGGLWAIKAGSPNTATIGKTLEVTDPANSNAVTASINRTTGIGDFLGVTTNSIAPKTGSTLPIKSNIRILSDTATLEFRKADGTGGSSISLGGDQVTLQASSRFVPFPDNTLALGLGTQRWSQIRVGTGDSVFDGRIGIGKSPSYSLDTSGDIRANTTVYTSDARLKKDVSTLDNALELVTKLRGVHFRWIEPKSKSQKGIQTGLIAQEVEKIYPELVLTDKEGFKSVNYAALVAPLIEAVKQLKEDVGGVISDLNPLKEKVKSLEAENKDLKHRLQILENRMGALEKAAPASK